jgi:hypothetical protein
MRRPAAADEEPDSRADNLKGSKIMASKMKKMARQFSRAMRRRRPSPARLVLGGVMGGWLGHRILDSTAGTVVGALIGAAIVARGGLLK